MKFFSFVGGLILLVWFVPAMIWGVQVTDAMNRFQNGETDALAGIMDGPAPLAWWRNRTELKETFDPVELNRRRSVSMQIEVPFERILAPGETMPDEALRDLYVMARAPATLHPICAELLETLASRCDIGSSSGRASREGTMARMDATFFYAPGYEMGDPSSVQRGDVFWGQARLTDGGRVEQSPEGRAEAISRALSVCDAIREEFGNCVISAIIFGPVGRGDAVVASARYNVFANTSEHSRDTVDSAVARITAATLGATQ